MRDETQCTENREPFSQSHPKLPSVHKRLSWISLISNIKKFPATWTWTPCMKFKASGCVGLISRWIKLREWMYSIQEIWLKVWENEREYQIRSNEPADLQVEEQWTCDCRNWKDLWEGPTSLTSKHSIFQQKYDTQAGVVTAKKETQLEYQSKVYKTLAGGIGVPFIWWNAITMLSSFFRLAFNSVFKVARRTMCIATLASAISV